MTEERLQEIDYIFSYHIESGFIDSEVYQAYKELIAEVKKLQDKANAYKHLESERTKEARSLHRQKERYRKALEQIVNAPEDMMLSEHSRMAERVAKEALQGS